MAEDCNRQYMNEELEGFKIRINLTEYAAGQGYVLDRKASSRKSVAMAEPSGDKIVITRFHDQHWVYFSVRQEHSGTIIDLVQHTRGCNLGRVRQELRSWSGGGRPYPAPSGSVPPRDRDRLQGPGAGPDGSGADEGFVLSSVIFPHVDFDSEYRDAQDAIGVS
jgi:hypothetical protein